MDNFGPGASDGDEPPVEVPDLSAVMSWGFSSMGGLGASMGLESMGISKAFEEITTNLQKPTGTMTINIQDRHFRHVGIMFTIIIQQILLLKNQKLRNKLERVKM